MRFAVLNDNTVMNVIIADTQEIAQEATRAICIALEDESPVGKSWRYDGINFNPPVTEESTND